MRVHNDNGSAEVLQRLLVLCLVLIAAALYEYSAARCAVRCGVAAAAFTVSPLPECRATRDGR